MVLYLLNGLAYIFIAFLQLRDIIPIGIGFVTMTFYQVFSTVLICYCVTTMLEAAGGPMPNHFDHKSDYCRDHPHVCGYHGKCHSHTHYGYSCHCFSHYEGHNCEVLVVPHTDAPQETSTQTTPSPKTSTTGSTTSASTTTLPQGSTVKPSVTKTSPPISTVPTATASTSSSVHIHSVTCAKLSTIADVANQIIAYNQSAAECPSGNHSSPEAFVLKNCHLSLPAFWKKGPNVIKFCPSVPLYTPLAMFGPTLYQSTHYTIAGIFLGCLANSTGIKVR